MRSSRAKNLLIRVVAPLGPTIVVIEIIFKMCATSYCRVPTKKLLDTKVKKVFIYIGLKIGFLGLAVLIL